MDNGVGIICYRGMSWSRNFLNYFVLRKLFFSSHLSFSRSLTLRCLSLFLRYPLPPPSAPSLSLPLFFALSFHLAFILSSFRYPTAGAWEKYGHSWTLTYGTRMDIFLIITFARFCRRRCCRLYPPRPLAKCLLTSLRRMDPVRMRYILNVSWYVVRYLLVYVGYVSLGYTFRS